MLKVTLLVVLFLPCVGVLFIMLLGGSGVCLVVPLPSSVLVGLGGLGFRMGFGYEYDWGFYWVLLG